MKDNYDETLETFESFRKGIETMCEMHNRSKGTINESREGDDDEKEGDKSVPYTMQDTLMSSITSTAKTQFGASFTGLKHPMLYYPEDGDVTLSGNIPGMGGDVKFQFRYKDASGNGCFLWSNYLVLSDDTLNTLKKISGVYKNWKQSLSTAEDIKPMNYKEKKD